MSAAPMQRREFTRALRDLIAVFVRTADTGTRKALDRMDAELRFGDPAVFEHAYQRYRHWWQRLPFNSAAVRMAEGEFLADVEYALEHHLSVVEATEARAKARRAPR